jgi:hypothetical protein
MLKKILEEVISSNKKISNSITGLEKRIVALENKAKFSPSYNRDYTIFQDTRCECKKIQTSFEELESKNENYESKSYAIGSFEVIARLKNLNRTLCYFRIALSPTGRKSDQRCWTRRGITDQTSMPKIYLDIALFLWLARDYIFCIFNDRRIFG